MQACSETRKCHGDPGCVTCTDKGTNEGRCVYSDLNFTCKIVASNAAGYCDGIGGCGVSVLLVLA
jgi:hypothetical protein